MQPQLGSRSSGAFDGCCGRLERSDYEARQRKFQKTKLLVGGKYEQQSRTKDQRILENLKWSYSKNSRNESLDLR